MHITENLDEQHRGNLVSSLGNNEGIVAAEFCPLRYHLMLVRYDRDLYSSQDVLAKVKSPDYTGCRTDWPGIIGIARCKKIAKQFYFPHTAAFVNSLAAVFILSQGNNQAKVIGMLGVPHAPRGAEYQYLLKVRKWPNPVVQLAII